MVSAAAKQKFISQAIGVAKSRMSGPKKGASVAPKTRTIKPTRPGQKPITFKPGGLHRSLNVPPGKPIPAGKMRKALAGGYGPRAEKQARFAKNVLTAGRRRRAK